MPMATGSSAVSEALKRGGVLKALDAHKADETTLSAGGDLPPGIEGGIAKLVDARISLYEKGDNKGKPFMYLAGVVLQPDEYAGLRTSQMVALCDDPPSWANRRTVDEHAATAANELRKLGLDTSALGPDDWEPALAALKESAPQFRFRTWANKPTKERPNPRTVHDWRGLTTGIDAYKSNGAAVEDHSAPNNAPEETATATEESAGEDWEALGAAADGGDAEAQQKLTDAGIAAGLTKKQIEEEIATWSEVAAAVIKAGTESGSDGGAAAEPSADVSEWKPEKEHVYMFKPKGARKSEEFEVTAVFKETLTLKRIRDGAIFKGIKWSANPDMLDGRPLET